MQNLKDDTVARYYVEVERIKEVKEKMEKEKIEKVEKEKSEAGKKDNKKANEQVFQKALLTCISLL